jgi:hypothetical protein
VMVKYSPQPLEPAGLGRPRYSHRGTAVGVTVNILLLSYGVPYFALKICGHFDSLAREAHFELSMLTPALRRFLPRPWP